ncbi:MAG TPA: carboxypeptidase-like regulatory domain-containing protein, partial [Chryseolinea sp.]|nr:carboxypeptidase-like regulatory domain-containing protein [Chryseolinea sp.]
MKVVCFLLFIFFCTNVQAQTTGLSLLQKVRQAVFPTKDSILTQSILGKVFEKQTLQPLAAANIMLLHESAAMRGTVTDTSGIFTFDKVTVDRFTLKISYVGYKEVVLTILVDASRQLTIDIPMEIAPFYLTEVKIHSLDEIAPVGANLINTDELNRHAGNRGEAIRKVAVLPGIQNADDSRNDIIIRGNSPQSVLWRVEGINIPNPNHFNIPGTSGGPVSLINDRILAGSSFYSGSFSAAYGNTASGIFDLQFRNGSAKANHSTFQLGLLGAEASNEGPLSKAHKASYVFSIRQSTIGIFEAMNIDLG